MTLKWLVAVLAAGGFLGHAGPVGVVPGRILVRAKPGCRGELVKDLVRPFNGGKVGEIKGLGIQVVQVPARAWRQALQGLQRNPNLEFAEPDSILAPGFAPNDTYYAKQWHLPRIQADTAWNTTAGSAGLVMAILDTGVDSTHPDLAPNLVRGWNFFDGNPDTSDVHGHGTAVAGTAGAAANNRNGVAGVAWGCKIMPVRVSDPNGYAYESTIAQALNWAADQGVRVVNISYRVSNSATVRSAAQYFQSKGGVVVVSAGNEGTFDSAPANPYVLTVSGTDSSDAIATWSNTGNNIDLAAPGSSILTTSRGGGYSFWSGTSFSAPIVAGAAALVLSANPSLTGPEAMDILRRSADDLGAPGFDTRYGHGLVNVQRAVSAALAAGDTVAPEIAITSPAQGDRAGNGLTVTVNATDNAGVARVELYVNGVPAAVSTASPFTFRWSSNNASRGAYALQAKAVDLAGNSSFSSMVTVYR